MGLKGTCNGGASLSAKVTAALVAEDGTIVPAVAVDARKEGAVVAAAPPAVVTEGGTTAGAIAVGVIQGGNLGAPAATVVADEGVLAAAVAVGAVEGRTLAVMAPEGGSIVALSVDFLEQASMSPVRISSLPV